MEVVIPLGALTVVLLSLLGIREYRHRQVSSALRRAARSSEAARQRLAKMLEYADDGLILFADHGAMWSSPSFVRMLGRPGPADASEWFGLLHPNDRPAVVEAIRRAEDQPGVPVTVEARVARADGSHVPTRQIVTDLSADPLVGCMIVNVRDLSEQQRASVELAEAMRLYQFLAENANEVLVIAAADRTITYASAASQSMLHVAPAALVGRPLEALVHPEDRPLVRAAVTNAEWSGGVARVEVRAAGDGERHRWVRFDVSSVSEPGAAVQFHVTIDDVTARRDAEAAMAASEQRFRSLAAQTRELVTLVDLDGTIAYISPSVREVLGHDPPLLTGVQVRRLVPADELADLRRAIVNASTTAVLRHRVQHADGSMRWLETLPQVLTNRDGEPDAVLLSSRDITDRLELEQRLHRERNLLAAILDNVHAGVIAVDEHGVILDANDAFCRVLGTELREGTPIEAYVPTHQLLDPSGDEVPIPDRPLEVALAGGSIVDRLFVVVTGDGHRSELIANARPLLGEDGHIEGAVLTYEDVTALRAAQDDLRRLATIDPVTDLPNRRHLVDHLTDAMRRHTRSPGLLALLFLDLDGFKAVNDTHGHETGDGVLREAAARIRSAVRVDDFVARYGGDEFVIVTEHVEHDGDAEQLARRVEEALSAPFTVERGIVRIGASVGITRLVDASSLDDLLSKADHAMYERKKARREAIDAIPSGDRR